MNIASDGSSSFVRDNVALQTVVENYSICLQNAQQLTSLQKYLIEVNNVIDKENEKRGIDIKLPDMPWKKEAKQ
jgi:predicted TIM-barrel enzyme